QPAEIQQLEGYDLSVAEWERRDAFVPRYNIAPHTQAPVLRRRNSKIVISTMKWGMDKNLSTFNARAERLISNQDSGMWAGLRGSKRCVAVCQGYYEWKDKQPHFVKPKDGRLMLLAGLYDAVVLQGTTTTVWSFAIVTRAAAGELSWLHHRQPVILDTPEALTAWLDTSSQRWNQDLAKLLAPTACDLECYPVPKEVGKVGNESPTFIQPLAPALLPSADADNSGPKPNRVLVYQVSS
ncbi:hypothetical protein DFH08DRAFT_693051, partial [Mycena albidolilacea]